MIDDAEVGQKFHKLTIKKLYRDVADNKDRTGTWLYADVKCDCRKVRKRVHFQKIKQGQLKSCGCLKHGRKAKKKLIRPAVYGASSE